MNRKLKNLIIDATWPLIFWGLLYLIFAVALLGWWTWQTYTQWYMMLIVFAPLSGVSGRVLNRWRRILRYEYKGYE